MFAYNLLLVVIAKGAFPRIVAIIFGLFGAALVVYAFKARVPRSPACGTDYGGVAGNAKN